MKSYTQILLTLMLSVILISGCSGINLNLNLNSSLEIGKEARRAGDYELAAKHLAPLAEFGIDEAKYEFALVILRKKDPSFEDYKQARLLLMEVSEKREKNALFEIARLYQKGLGVTKSVSIAKDYYKASGNKGYQRANFELARMLLKERKYTAAKELCEGAFSQGYHRAAMCIGDMYRKGQGVYSPDSKKALAWYMIAQRHDVKGADEEVKKISQIFGDRFILGAEILSKELEEKGYENEKN